MNEFEELHSLLRQVKTIAVIGAKDKPGQPVDGVGRYLIDAGYTVFPVHPKRQNVWGLPTYASLLDIPSQLDAVDVFRAPQYCPAHARECLQLDPLPRIFWLQLGITSSKSRDILKDTGVYFIQNRCLMIDHKKIFKGQTT